MTIDFKQDILAPVASDFATMDKFINEGITSKVALVMAVSKHVVEAGGKRMRPVMCLLAAKACGADDLDKHRKLAAIIEMLHTATLVHDDVVDDLFLKVKDSLIQMISANPKDGEYALDLLMIAKYFERIGDHATNIAEWVVFSVTGVHEQG